jgi:hypothetical protein
VDTPVERAELSAPREIREECTYLREAVEAVRVEPCGPAIVNERDPRRSVAGWTDHEMATMTATVPPNVVTRCLKAPN